MSIDDFRDAIENATAERCVPLIRISLAINENVGIPENRRILEDQITDIFGYVESRVYTTVRGGAATHENFAVLIEPNPAEFWRSLNRKVDRLYDWADQDQRIDVGRDLGVFMECGDPEHMIRELEEGFRR